MWLSPLIVIFALLAINNAMIYQIDKTYHTDTQEGEAFLTFGITGPAEITGFNIDATIDGTEYSMYRMGKGGASFPVPEFYSMIEGEFTISRPGFYGFFIKTKEGTEFPLKVTGTIHILHQHTDQEVSYNHELPVEAYRAYRYYLFSIVCITAIAFVWGLLMKRYAKSLVMHHHAITFILGIIALETLLKFAHLNHTNETGLYHMKETHLLTQIQVFRHTAVRLFLLLLSLGWGVILPTDEITPKMKQQLCQFGLLYYYITSIASHTAIQITRADHYGASKTILGICIVARYIMEFQILYVVSKNLSDILLELKRRGQSEKHVHYTRFAYALMSCLVLVIINVMVKVYVSWNIDRYFDMTMLVDECFWHFVFLGMLCKVMVLWRPTKNSKSFAYVQQVSTRDPDDDLELGDVKSRRKTLKETLEENKVDGICLDVERLSPVMEYTEFDNGVDNADDYDLSDLEYQQTMQQL